MDTASLRILIQKLIDGSIDSDEYVRLMDYIASHDVELDDIPEPARTQAFRSLPHADVTNAFRHVRYRTGIKRRKKGKVIWLPLAAAAVAILAIIGSAFFSPIAKLLEGPTEIARFLTLTVPYGKVDTLVLADGSRIWVNAGSTIDYPIDQEGTIVVRLKGEAFFEIAPKDRRFVVETGSIRTTVLGTAFNINAHDSSTVDVTVLRGKVRVDNGNENVATLTKNQQVSLQKAASSTHLTDVDATKYIAWIDDRLVFSDVRLNRALNVLSRRFGVSFSLDNEAIANCIFSAAFEPGESLTKVLNVLSRTNGFVFERQGNIVTLRGDGCP